MGLAADGGGRRARDPAPGRRGVPRPHPARGLEPGAVERDPAREPRGDRRGDRPLRRSAADPARGRSGRARRRRRGDLRPGEARRGSGSPPSRRSAPASPCCRSRSPTARARWRELTAVARRRRGQHRGPADRALARRAVGGPCTSPWRRDGRVDGARRVLAVPDSTRSGWPEVVDAHPRDPWRPPARGRAVFPGDKSIAHRWLILAATARGPQPSGRGSGFSRRPLDRCLPRGGVGQGSTFTRRLGSQRLRAERRGSRFHVERRAAEKPARNAT